MAYYFEGLTIDSVIDYYINKNNDDSIEMYNPAEIKKAE